MEMFAVRTDEDVLHPRDRHINHVKLGTDCSMLWVLSGTTICLHQLLNICVYTMQWSAVSALQMKPICCDIRLQKMTLVYTMPNQQIYGTP
jgi:hypothetical protein